MTTSTSTGTKAILCIKVKGFLGGNHVYRAEGPDEDGIKWITWYLEKNTDDYSQLETAYYFAGDQLHDILIDDDVADEVSDRALEYLATRMRSASIKPNRTFLRTMFCATGDTRYLEM